MSFRFTKIGFRGPLEPIVPEDFDRVLRSLNLIAAEEIMGRTVTVAAPADALGVAGEFRKVLHSYRHSPAIDLWALIHIKVAKVGLG